jgi:flagellar hook-length control protein FliK
MAIPVASTNALIPTPAAAGPSATGSTQARAAGAESPFQTILTTTQTQATTTAEVAAADAVTDATELETDELDTELDAALAVDPSLTGLLAFATQVLAPPANEAESQATGQTALTEPTAQVPADTTRTRADQLRLDRSNAFLSQVTGAAPQTSSQATAPTQATEATEAVPAAPAQPTVTAQIATAAVAVPTTATFATRPGGASSIPAQGQILASVIPPVPTPANLSVTAPPAGEPTAAIPATAVPSAQLGDRPAMAGERLAADAEAGARLATSGPPTSVMFANALAQEVSAPLASPATESVVPDAPFVVTGTAPAATVATPIATEANFGRVVADTALPLGREDQSGPTDDATTSAAVVAGPQFPTLASAPRGTTEVTAVNATPAAQIADTIVMQARVLERDGGVEFQMRLDPPELGRLQIKLVTRGDEIHGQVLVADEAVRGLIESQLPELRQRLEAAGVNVQRFDVSVDPGTGGNRNPYRDAAQEYFPRVPSSNGQPVAPRARIGRPDSGSLDVTV